MSRDLLRAVLLAWAVAALAAPGTGSTSSLDDRAVLRLTAPAPRLENAGDDRHHVPRIHGFGFGHRPGEPMLPVKILRVAIPEGSVPEIRILRAPSVPLGKLDIAPVPHVRIAARGDDGRPDPRHPAVDDFRPDPKTYGADREFPEAPVRLGATGYLRQQRFVEVLFTPVTYNPVTRHARYFPEVQAEVLFSPGGSSSTVKAGGSFRPDPLFEETYRESLVNYEQGKQFRAVESASQPDLQATAAPAVGGGSPAYKISVSRDGIYRLTYTYLQSHAPELLALDPRTFSLAAEGVEVPISIRDATGASGESDGSFGPADFLEFFGRAKVEPPTILNYDFGTIFADIFQANDFTDTQVYWLTSTGGSHLRVSEVSGTPGSPAFPLAADFQSKAVWEENNLYVPLEDAEPFFSMPSLLAGSAQAQRDLLLPLPGLAAVSGSAAVTIRLRGGSSLTNIPDHRTRIWLNGNTAGGADFTTCQNAVGPPSPWDGEIICEQTFSENQTGLTDPTTIHASAPGIVGVSVDRQYPDKVTINYRRLFRSLQETLAFDYPNQDSRFEVSGFNGTVPTIYEITRTLPGSGEASPVRITGAVVSGAPTSTYAFQVPRDQSPSAPATRSFFVAGPGGISAPDGMNRAADQVLRDPTNSADLVVIAARVTVDASPGGALDTLLAHRLAAQGLTSRVVYIDQIYDEFSFGLRNVNAIRSFLSYAYDNWRGASGTARPLSFVLLVGDATPDYKNTLPSPWHDDWVDQVPTPVMFHASTILGYYSSDNWLAAFRGTDQVPDAFIGRISTRTAAKSADVFNKILRYEETPPPGLWKGRAILVAGDGKVAGESDQFEANEEELRTAYFSAAPYSSPSPPLYFAQPPWNSIDAAQFNADLKTELANGAALLSVFLHGSFETWGLETFFTTQDADQLTNDGLLPFLVGVNCLTGGFHFFNSSGAIGEAMVNNAAGGSIATLAPSGLTNPAIGEVVNDSLFAAMLGPAKERVLGAATNKLLTALLSQNAVLDMQGLTFLGDPATVLAMPAPPPPTGLAATSGNAQVSLAWSPPTPAAAGYRIYRSQSAPSGPYSAVTCDPVTATSCIDRTVQNAGTYYYYAVSLDGQGFEGRASNFNSDCDSGPDCVLGKPLNPGPPSIPAGLASHDPGTGGRLQISWNANPEADLKNYFLYYGTQSGQYPSRLTLGPTTTFTQIGGLTDGVRYYFAISATNTSNHESLRSPEISDVPHLIQGIAPPRAISDLRLARSGNDLVLTWSRPTLDIYGRPTTVVRYNVYRGVTPGFLPFAASPHAVVNSGSTTTFTDVTAALPAAGNLYYLVTAVDANGFSSGAGRELPNGIQNLAVSVPAAGTISLAWPAVTTDLAGDATIIDHYQVHMSSMPIPRQSLGPSTLIRDNVHTLTVDVPVSGSPLYFSVLAVDNRGNLSPF